MATSGSDQDVVYQQSHHSTERGHQRVLTIVPLIALIFYEVTGGPYGSEDSVRATQSPLLAIVGFVVFPLVWSLPEALITAELGTLFPENSGYCIWVAAAFGKFAGWFEGSISFLSSVADNSIYPVLFVDYLKDQVPELEGGWYRTVTLVGFSLFFSALNWFGLVIVGRVAILCMVFSLLPFLGILTISTWHIEPSLWHFDEMPVWEDVDWRLYLNTVFWNVNYWDSASCLAGEVDNPSKTFPLGLLLAAALMVFLYISTILAGTGICVPPSDPTSLVRCRPFSDWEDGYFSKVAHALGGRFLQNWLLVGAAVANIGQFEAEMSVTSYQLQGMADRGWLPKFFASRSRHGTPTFGIITSVLGICVICLNPFQTIIQSVNLLYSFGVLLEFAAFLRLRYKYPNVYRPFRIPLSFGWLCVWLVPTILAVGAIVAVADVTSFIVLGGGILACCLSYLLVEHARRHKWAEFSEVNVTFLPSPQYAPLPVNDYDFD
eukprot:TRINITY_DN9125_c0_g1_i1.p1 TRINITY_DN9125_c0_g1~~TRINITY_DN9125_c0_g1_i1.p1  ORF type:complete len:491 (+),score=94.09 TRINITY_DN9125_c0_g1_i1:277-1749(+)